MKGAARIKRLGLKYAPPYGSLEEQSQFYVLLHHKRIHKLDDALQDLVETGIRSSDALSQADILQCQIHEEKICLSWELGDYTKR